MVNISMELTAAEVAIIKERRRQVEKEGWSPEYDDRHDDGSLALVAAIFATPIELFRWADTDEPGIHLIDPWPDDWSRDDGSEEADEPHQRRDPLRQTARGESSRDRRAGERMTPAELIVILVAGLVAALGFIWLIGARDESPLDEEDSTWR